MPAASSTARFSKYREGASFFREKATATVAILLQRQANVRIA
jgi:hypothetical protein